MTSLHLGQVRQRVTTEYIRVIANFSFDPVPDFPEHVYGGSLGMRKGQRLFTHHTTQKYLVSMADLAEFSEFKID